MANNIHGQYILDESNDRFYFDDDPLSPYNKEHYIDRTAYEALTNVERSVNERTHGYSTLLPDRKCNNKKIESMEYSGNKQNPGDARFYKYLHTLFHISELCGFKIVGRLNVIDIETGKEWR